LPARDLHREVALLRKVALGQEVGARELAVRDQVVAERQQLGLARDARRARAGALGARALAGALERAVAGHLALELARERRGRVLGAGGPAGGEGNEEQQREQQQPARHAAQYGAAGARRRRGPNAAVSRPAASVHPACAGVGRPAHRQRKRRDAQARRPSSTQGRDAGASRRAGGICHSIAQARRGRALALGPEPCSVRQWWKVAPPGASGTSTAAPASSTSSVWSAWTLGSSATWRCARTGPRCEPGTKRRQPLSDV